MKRLSLAIESDLGNVSLASLAVRAICLYAGLAESDADQVELCMVEAVTNSIRHAYHGALDQTVSIFVVIREGLIQFDVCDIGTPMSPDRAEQFVRGEKPTDAENSDRSLLPEGGRGLQIIRRVMDEVAYAQAFDGNRLTMIKNLPASGKLH